METLKSKYIKELSKCRDPGRQLELIVAINNDAIMYEDLSDEIKNFYNLPVIDEGIDVVKLEGDLITEVYQCKNTCKMIIGAHELGTFFNLYLHILSKHFSENLGFDNIPKKYIVGNLNTKFRDTIDDIIRVDVKEELKKYFPNNINHIRNLILFEFGGDFGYLHAKPKNSIQRKEYQIRTNEWFSGLAKIFKPFIEDKELINETKTDNFILETCNKIIELKKIFETNPLYEDEFTKLHFSKSWLMKLRKSIISLNYMLITLPMSDITYLLNINSKYNTQDIQKHFETTDVYNNTNKIKINYNNLYMYLPKDSNTDFFYDVEKMKIICETKKHYWFIEGWF